MVYYFNSLYSKCALQLSYYLNDLICETIRPGQDIVFLCIGSDRSTGDSLGPLLGYKLKYLENYSGFHVFGDLKHPVHATNLEFYIENINRTFLDPYIIAVDASLGKDSHIGYVTIAKGPLKPGLGVKKKLPEVGAIHITGIVNSSETADSSILQTTRLSVVMQLADVISKAVDMLTISSESDDYLVSR